MNHEAHHPRALLAGWLIAATGCSTSALPDDPAEAGSAEAAPSMDGSADEDAVAQVDGGVCTLTSLAVLVDTVDQDFAVPVTYEGKPAALLIDTGSPASYLWLPIGDGGAALSDASDEDGSIAESDAACATELGCTPDAGSVVIGCETLPLGGFPQVPSSPVGGIPFVGTIGDDRLLVAPTWLDLAGNQLQFHAPGDPFSQAASWPATAFTRPYGYLRVEDVSLNGTPTKLLLDTGSPDVLWLGQQPAPGDVEVMGEDVNGEMVVFYLSQVTVSIGSWSKTVQVLKAPSFPYFQPLATAAGVQGLFGVSAFPDGVVFDTDAMQVRVAP